jgi:hypothetical protein
VVPPGAPCLDYLGSASSAETTSLPPRPAFTLIDRRHQRASTAITSNIKLSAWGKYLGDATLAAAVLDRLAASAIRLDIDGPSYRQHLARQRAGVQPTADEALPEEASP